MPGSSGSSAATAASARNKSGSTSSRRRAASCSPEWRPEPVEEESGEAEDANALGLEFEVGVQAPEAGREARVGPQGRRTGHRAVASESVVMRGSVNR